MEVPDGTEEVWLLPGRNTAFYSRPDPAAQQRGNLLASAAHWCAVPALHIYLPLIPCCAWQLCSNLHCVSLRATNCPGEIEIWLLYAHQGGAQCDCLAGGACGRGWATAHIPADVEHRLPPVSNRSPSPCLKAR